MQRLDAIEAKLAAMSVDGGSNSNGAGAAEEVPISIKAWDSYVTECVDPFVAACDALGGDAVMFGKLTKEAWSKTRNFLLMASVCKEPPQSEITPLLKGIVDKIQEINRSIQRNDWETHGKVVQEGASSLNWLVIKPCPADYVESSIGGCDLHANRIRVKYKGVDDKQITYCNTHKKIITGLMVYIKEYHTTGVRWNKKPDALDVKDYDANSATGASTKTQTPAPASTSASTSTTKMVTSEASDAPPAAKASLFAALNKGTAITGGLKKVTKDQQTWRAEFKDTGNAPPLPSVTKSKPSHRAVEGPKGPPRLEYVAADRKWFCENQAQPCEIKVR